MERQLRNLSVTEKDLNDIFIKIEDIEKDFINVSKLFLQTGNLYSMDYYASAIVNRSISLMRGFLTLSKDNNYISSVPLIRVQLDNCLRFYAINLVEDVNVYFIQYLKGKHIRNLKDRDGKKMTDAYLSEKLDKLVPGIRDLYKNSSGYIHFSNEHSFLQTNIVKNKERTVATKIGFYDFFTIDKKVDFSYNMFKASETLLMMVKGWAIQKKEHEK